MMTTAPEIADAQPVSSSTVRSHAAYRPDIDGLRAVAILSVLGFHTVPRLVRGGFVGVDVFFVISGYLISGIIVAGLAEDRFSLRQFYARRIRRIFPALIVVMAACFIVGWVALLADEYTQLGKHIAAGSGFSVNLVLWGESGYFDTAAALKPLLHLWSLGIEEQFYIVWPLLLWLAWKARVNLWLLTLSIVAVSFGLGIRTTHANAVAAFYSPITRFWELLIGCSLALGSRSSERADETEGAGLWQHVKASAGMVLIAAAVFGVTRDAEFPGWWALLPTVGAFLLISAGPHAWVNLRLLSQPVMVWIGLISYPLYLWHWPLLSFARIRASAPLPESIAIATALVSVALAWLTFTLVERPARRGRGATVKLLIVLMAAIGGLGVFTVAKNGFDARFPESIRAYANYQYAPGVDARPLRCWLSGAQPFTDYAADCIDESPSQAVPRPLIFIWGDSHAARLYAGMNQYYRGRYRLAQFTRDSCPPLLGFGDPTCSEGNRLILERIQQTRPAAVVLFASWRVHSADWGSAESRAARQLRGVISELKRIGIPTVIVVGPAPMWFKPLPRLVYEAAAWDVPLHRVPHRLNVGIDPSYAGLDATFRKLLAGQPATYFSMRDALCNADGCLTHVADGPDSLVSWDYGHLTTPGAAYIAARLLP